MSFSLSFTEEFYTGEGYSYDEPPPESETPTSVLQALVSMHPDDCAEYCRSVVKVEPDDSTAYRAAIKYIRETVDTCTDIRSPVEVWLDPDGFWTVLVYDSRAEG